MTFHRDEQVTTHPCNYKDEGCCKVCGMTEELMDRFKDIPFFEQPGNHKLFLEQVLIRRQQDDN